MREKAGTPMPICFQSTCTGRKDGRAWQMDRWGINRGGRTSLETKERSESGVALWEWEKSNTAMTSFSTSLRRGANRGEIRVDQHRGERGGIDGASVYGKQVMLLFFLEDSLFETGRPAPLLLPRLTHSQGNSQTSMPTCSGFYNPAALVGFIAPEEKLLKV